MISSCSFSNRLAADSRRTLTGYHDQWLYTLITIFRYKWSSERLQWWPLRHQETTLEMRPKNTNRKILSGSKTTMKWQSQHTGAANAYRKPDMRTIRKTKHRWERLFILYGSTMEKLERGTQWWRAEGVEGWRLTRRPWKKGKINIPIWQTPDTWTIGGTKHR